MHASLLTPIYFVMCMSSAQAGIYTCKDQDGNTVYLDTPSSEICPDAEEVKVDELPDLIEVKPLAVPSTTAKPKASKPDAKALISRLQLPHRAIWKIFAATKAGYRLAFELPLP